MTVVAREQTLLDIQHRHLVSWTYGKKIFGYAGVYHPPMAILVGEGPGPHTDKRLPLFPHPPTSAAGRLLAYSGLYPAEYLSKLACVNLCDTPTWSVRRAQGTAVHIIAWMLELNGAFHPRVLLLGRKVADVWQCDPERSFGFERREFYDVAWIPHPSGRCRLYNERANQLRARRAVLWAIGDRRTP